MTSSIIPLRVTPPRAADAALIKLLAEALGVPRSSIEIVAGHASRHKRVSLPLSAEEIRRRTA